MDIWQAGSPEAPVPTGRLGRWLDTAGDDPLLARNIGEVLPPLAVGTRATAAALAVGGNANKTTLADAALAAFAVPDAADSPAARMVVASYAARQRCEQTFGSLTDLDDGDLKTTTDFRAVYGEVLDRMLGADPTRVSDKVPPAVGLFA